MTEKFSELHVQGINSALANTPAICKLSKVYKEVGVVGVPGVLGTVVVFLDKASKKHPDRDVWVCHTVSGDPKSVADGIADCSNPTVHEFLHWGDMTNHLKKVFR